MGSCLKRRLDISPLLMKTKIVPITSTESLLHDSNDESDLQPYLITLYLADAIAL